MSALFQLAKIVRIDSAGRPRALTRAYFYETTTLNDKTVYADAKRTIPHPQGLQSDSEGQFPPIYINALDTYKLILKDSQGVQIDNIDPAFDALFAPSEITAIVNPPTPAEGGVTVVDARFPPYHVDRYGTNTVPGTTDMTAAFAAAITAARVPGGGGNVYWGETGTYLTMSPLVLSAFNVNPVNLICATPEWYSSPQQCVITSSISGPTLDVSGASGNYSVAPMIDGGFIQNVSVDSSACVVKSDYSGGLRMRDCWLRHNNAGVYAATGECISARFTEVVVDSVTGVGANYKGGFRNPLWFGGRSYSADYAFDVSGDDPNWYGTNSEFCQVIFRPQALTSATFHGGHLESAQCVVTNATTVPINRSGAWVDNGSAGVGISGTVKFLGCQFALTNANSNFAVLKGAGGFNFTLEFDSCTVTATTKIVGGSFTPGDTTALPSGTKIVVRNTTGLTVEKPPLDGGSGYLFENATAQGFIDTVGLKIGGNEINSKYDEGTYSPTWASTGTAVALVDGTCTGRFTQNGNRVDAQITLTMGSSTTYGTGSYSFTLPVAAGANGACGVVLATDTGANRYFGACVIEAGVLNLYTDASPAVAYAAATPFTFGSTDTIQATVSYFTN